MDRNKKRLAFPLRHHSPTPYKVFNYSTPKLLYIILEYCNENIFLKSHLVDSKLKTLIDKTMHFLIISICSSEKELPLDNTSLDQTGLHLYCFVMWPFTTLEARMTMITG